MTIMQEKCMAILDRWFEYILHRPIDYYLSFNMDRNEMIVLVPTDIFMMVKNDPALFTNYGVARALRESSFEMAITLKSIGVEVYNVPMS